MFESLTYKNKFIALLVAIPLVLFMAYKKSFSATIQSKKALTEVKSKLALVAEAQQEFLSLRQDVKDLDAIIGKEVANPDEVQQEIFDIFSEIPFKTTLEKLDESHKLEDKYFNVYTNSLLLEGSFNNLLQTTYFYEKEFEYSRVVSLSFFIKKNLRTRKKKLFERVIFQNYDKK